MKATAASKTAQYMALFRALEFARPAYQRLFTDPYAFSFLSGGLKMATRLSGIPFLRNTIRGIIQRKIPGAYSSGLARTRYIDDLLESTVQQGVQQVIILGAGFDTRGVRLPFLQKLKVIEVDHPNTAKEKMAIIAQRLGKLPENITYYQLDFNVQTLDAFTFDFSLPTTIIWEGVTNYLDAGAIDATFSFASRFAPGSFVIFTYVHNGVLHTPEQFFGAEKLLKDLEQIEERWTFGFDPEQLSAYLAKYHLQLKEDLGAADYRQRYMPERAEKGYEFYRVAMAANSILPFHT